MMMQPAALSIRIARCEAGWDIALSMPAPVSLATFLRGKAPETAAMLVPRLFSLCGAAQEAAIRSAFDLPMPAGLRTRIAGEILAEHILKLGFVWPSILGLAPDREMIALARRALHEPFARNELARRIFAPFARVPGDLDGFLSYVVAGKSVPARLFGVILGHWDRAWGIVTLPDFTPARPADWPEARQGGHAVENSPASRAGGPLLAALAATYGRGPLWRMAARLVEIDALLAGESVDSVFEGASEAARGTLLVRGEADSSGITAFERLSPTDFALAPGGAMEMALASLPVERDAPVEQVARLIIETIDPCMATALEITDA